MVFPTIEVTKAILSHNKNMVQTLQAETREYTRKYYKTKIWALRPHIIDDVMYSDTLIYNITSIRCFKRFQ